jgi:hypothetical protein
MLNRRVWIGFACVMALLASADPGAAQTFSDSRYASGGSNGLSLGAPRFELAWKDVKTSVGTGFTELPFLWSRGASNPSAPIEKGLGSQYRTRGLWLSIVEPMRLRDAIGARLEAAVLIPSSSHNASDSVDNSTYAGFPYAYDLSPASKTRWWLLDGQVSYDTPYGSLLAGLRYEYFDTRFYDFPFLSLIANPGVGGPYSIPVIVSAPGMESDFTVTSLIPYVGIEGRYGSPTNSVSMRIVGIPWFTPSIKSRTTQGGYSWGATPPVGGGNVSDRYEMSMSARKGYFYEAKVSCDTNAFGMGTFGLFVTASYMHAEFDGGIDFNTARITPSGPDPGAQFPTSGLYYNRRVYAIGATLSMPFVSPI